MPLSNLFLCCVGSALSCLFSPSLANELEPLGLSEVGLSSPTPVWGQRLGFTPKPPHSRQAFLRAWGPWGTGQQLAFSTAWKRESSSHRQLMALEPLYTMNSQSIYFCFDLVTEINWLFPFSTSIMSVSLWIWKFFFRYLCSKNHSTNDLSAWIFFPRLSCLSWADTNPVQATLKLGEFKRSTQRVSPACSRVSEPCTGSHPDPPACCWLRTFNWMLYSLNQELLSTCLCPSLHSPMFNLVGCWPVQFFALICFWTVIWSQWFPALTMRFHTSFSTCEMLKPLKLSW